MNRRSSRTTKRRKISKRAKRAKRLFTGFICALIICVSGSAFLVSAQGLSDHDTHTYYKSIEIQKGDTLWDIARQTKPADCGSTAEYVQVLKDMNRLGSDDIQSGQHLIVACNMWSVYFIFRYQYTSPCIDILTPSSRYGRYSRTSVEQQLYWLSFTHFNLYDKYWFFQKIWTKTQDSVIIYRWYGVQPAATANSCLKGL